MPLWLGLSAAVVLTAAGLILLLTDAAQEWRLLGAAFVVVGVGYGLLAGPLFAGLAELGRLRRDRAEQHARLISRLESLEAQLRGLAERQLLSERAKALASRDRDREALRQAIAEETLRGDWDAARALIDELDLKFGYRVEADLARVKLEEQKRAGAAAQFAQARETIERLCRSEDWAGAQQQASRLIAMHPELEAARALPGEIESRRQAFKRRLLERWSECVARHDCDAGMLVLRSLDPYLTPSEAERLAESARSIINDRKAKLRDMFAGAVAARNWSEAIRLGEAIQQEFPNARFAGEVAEAMPGLRERLAESQQPASAGTGTA